MKSWFCFLILIVMAGCSAKPKEAADDSPATPVEVAPAKLLTMHHIVAAEAVIYPINQATIVPKISAPVRKFSAQRGDYVRQGQLLAVLEDSDLRAATSESQQLYRLAQANLEYARSTTLPDDLTKAQSDVTSAREGLDAARKAYDNRVNLFKEGALAQKLVDDAKVSLVQAQSQFDTASKHLTSLETQGQSSQLKSAEAQASAAKAHFESSAAQSAYGEVRSPISGIVADRGVNVGDMASSASALFTIVDISRIVARASVPVNDASALRSGQSATIKGPDADIDAKVIVVSPTVDANTTTVQVWVEAANKSKELKLGSTVTIFIQAGDVPGAVSVPVSALLASDDGGEKVMVATAGGIAQERKVAVGVRNNGSVQILTGVKPGENVVTRGGLGLDDNSKIEIARPEAAKPEATNDDK